MMHRLQACAFEIIPPPLRQICGSSPKNHVIYAKAGGNCSSQLTNSVLNIAPTSDACARLSPSRKLSSPNIFSIHGEHLGHQSSSSNCYLFGSCQFLDILSSDLFLLHILTHDLSGLAVSDNSCAGSKDLAQCFRRTRGVNGVIPSSDDKNLCSEQVWLAKYTPPNAHTHIYIYVLCLLYLLCTLNRIAYNYIYIH